MNILSQIAKAGILASVREVGILLRVGYDAAYAEAKRRDTLTYKLKTELANNAAAAAAGIEALRHYDPDADLRALKVKATEVNAALEGEQTF